MPSKCLFLLLSLLYLWLISAKTFQRDVSDLDEILDLVLNSTLTLRGWKKDTDPCGRVVPCGINDLDECHWEGIACVMDNGRHRVAGIEIIGLPPHQQLDGFLPGKLPSALKSISLPNNRLRGNLSDPACEEGNSNCPDIWSKNNHLTTINLDGNEVVGTLPNWQRLDDLETIGLARNQLTGSLPPQWKEKIHLTTIDLSRNSLTGPLPDEWSKLAALESLSLSTNHLVKEIPDSWFSMPKLMVLDVAENCALCGKAEPREGLRVYGDGTNLKTDCSECSGCECHQGTLQFVVTNVLLSLSVLVLSLFAWFVRQWCKRNETQPLPIQQDPSIVMKPFEPPTIVVSPGDEVFFAKVLEEGPFSSSSSESLSSKSSSSSSRDTSDDESSEWQSESDTDSVDSKVLAFVNNSSPIAKMTAYRARSTGHAGICETIQENSSSETDSKSEVAKTRHRRSKSALEGTSTLSLAQFQQSPATDEGPSSSSVSQSNDASNQQVGSKKLKKKLRSFKRRNRRGIAGDFRISEPQRSIGLPEDFNVALPVTQPSETKAIQTTGSFSNKK